MFASQDWQGSCNDFKKASKLGNQKAVNILHELFPTGCQ